MAGACQPEKCGIATGVGALARAIGEVRGRLEATARTRLQALVLILREGAGAVNILAISYRLYKIGISRDYGMSRVVIKNSIWQWCKPSALWCLNIIRAVRFPVRAWR